ncbi:hypothetical protein [Mesobacillus stamsii]|uniref:IDEAL domain-containing protein n=1 Tax=Mesobacillus stamsii TaxID=225347 RepID=A0ABU0FPY6_9BACI|nr:hypothetical protein [Mesobacillus stamsii]MDQ0411885.1 hypothetical protein [Mesobacillus stamsii]
MGKWRGERKGDRMGEKEMFERAGFSTVYDQHGYNMWISALEDSIDAELLDHVADAYSFENAETMYYDFLFQL